jgi:FAD synthetase
MTEIQEGAAAHLNGTPTDDCSPDPSSSSSLRATCARLHARVEAFLREEAPTETLRQVQQQTRKSLAVIHEALKRYR